MKVRGKLGIVLTVLAGIGMIATVVMAAKKAPEAKQAKDAALALKREETGDETAELTTVESVKAQLPCYAPVIFTAAVSVGTLVGSQILPQQAVWELERWKKTYRDISEKVNGKAATRLMDQMAAQGTDGMKKETFVLEYDGKNILFESTLLDVYEAEYDTNRFFTGTGEITYNEMMKLFHLDPVEDGDYFGWNIYLGEAWYGYCWIDFCHRRGMLNGKPVTFIDMPFECHSLVEDEELLSHGTG